MLDLMSDEETFYCQVTVESLRMELVDIHNNLRVIKLRLEEELDPPLAREVAILITVRDRLEARRSLNAKLIAGIREVLVEPPSLESRVIGCINRLLSFRFI